MILKLLIIIGFGLKKLTLVTLTLYGTGQYLIICQQLKPMWRRPSNNYNGVINYCH